MEENHSESLRKQHQQLIEIGQSLQRIRMDKGISLETVASQTLIPQRLLVAIETGNIDELPEPFYIKALIVKYARAIDAEKSISIPTLTPDSSASSPVAQTTAKRHSINFQLRSLHLYLLYVLLVIISVKGITALIERPVIVNQPPALENNTSDKPVANVNPTQADKSSDSLPQFVSQATNSESVMVGINLQDRCWLKVMVDGKLAFEGTLPKGTKRTWTGKEEVTIRAGNAGGVMITFNNGQKQILGAPGQVEEVTYTVN